jgi:HK97 family phage major capsid protein
MSTPQTYSIGRLLASAVNHDPAAAAYERSVSDALSDSLTTEHGRQVSDRHGVFVPMAALNTGTATAGGNLVFERDGGFVGALRPRMQLARLGASITTGDAPPLRVTTQDSEATFVWVADNPGSDMALSEATFGESILTLRTGASTVAVSRQLLRQATPSMERIVRRDLEAIAGAGIERAAINGSGVAPEPTGLLQTAGIQTVPIGANGGAPTYAHIVQLEELVADADADLQALGFYTTPTMRRKLRQTEKAAGSGVVWGDNGLLGYTSATSTLVPSDLDKGTTVDACHAILYGDWSRLHVALYALEILVDPVSRAREGLVELTLFAHVGVGVSHPSAFAVITDATDV